MGLKKKKKEEEKRVAQRLWQVVHGSKEVSIYSRYRYKAIFVLQSSELPVSLLITRTVKSACQIELPSTVPTKGHRA